MSATAYLDPQTGDLYILAAEVWHAYLGPYAHHCLIDDSVVPDRLEVMAAYIPINRGPRREHVDV